MTYGQWCDMNVLEPTMGHVDLYVSAMLAKQRSQLRGERERGTPDARELAVLIVDVMRGYTREFAPNPRGHGDEYDRVEAILLGRGADGWERGVEEAAKEKK